MRILIVEDELKIANSIKKGLEQEKFTADIASDGESGFDLATSEPYDAIILDRMLPNLDGITFTKNLRAEKIHTPILFLTAKGQIGDRVEGLDAGADDYLVKPFAFEELLARVRALTRRPKETTSETLTVADLTLNTKTYIVSRNGQQISLSAREFALLEYLMRHAGLILSKEQITNHVWNYEANVLPNTIEVYVGYLRGKIDKDAKIKLIQTVRGFGYRIENTTNAINTTNAHK